MRRQREWREIESDTRTPYMLGRLLGANEMAIQLLTANPENATMVAQVLERLVGYFVIEEEPKP